MKEKRNGKRRKRSDKVRGFYRPPAATMVVGRRKLLALVANDRRPERSTLRDSDFVEYFNIRNIHVIKKDLLRFFFIYI